MNWGATNGSAFALIEAPLSGVVVCVSRTQADQQIRAQFDTKQFGHTSQHMSLDCKIREPLK